MLAGKQLKAPEGPGEARRSTFPIFVNPWWRETAILLHSSSLKLLLISASISQGSPEEQNQQKVYTHKEIRLKELAHMVVGPGKSNTCRTVTG